MRVMPVPLALDREAIGELWRKYGVRSLLVFGSALSERFDDTRSDVDFLVEFADDLTSRFDAYCPQHTCPVGDVLTCSRAE